MNKFVFLNPEECNSFLSDINSYYGYVKYKLIRNGFASGIWKKLCNNPSDNRYVYLNIEFQKTLKSKIQITNLDNINKFSMCISADFSSVATVHCNHLSGIKCVTYLPKNITMDWKYFWDAYQSIVVDVKQNIIGLRIFNRSIHLGDPSNHLITYITPPWAIKVIRK